MRYGLEYNIKDATSQNWTEPFCNRLVTIIAHPIFDNSPGKIALAIKFSVCSWQRLKWVIPDFNDLFLLVIKEVAEEKGEISGAELVRDSIVRWRARWPQGQLTPWAQLLRAIVANSKRPISGSEFPHRVSTEHLSAIVASMDEIKHGKLVTYHSANLFERGLKDIRANVDLPTNDKDPIDQLLSEGNIHNRRLRVLHERHLDVVDIYNHVCQPHVARPASEDEYADIAEIVQSFEHEKNSQPAQRAHPAQHTQADTQARIRGQPNGAEETVALPGETDGNGREQSDDGGVSPPAKIQRRPGRPKNSKATPANILGSVMLSGASSDPPETKRSRGRPRKNVISVGTAPEQAPVSPRPDTAAAGERESAGLDNSNAPIVQMPRFRGMQKHKSDTIDLGQSNSAHEPAVQVSELKPPPRRAKTSVTSADSPPIALSTADLRAGSKNSLGHLGLFHNKLARQRRATIVEVIESSDTDESTSSSQDIACPDSDTGDTELYHGNSGDGVLSEHPTFGRPFGPEPRLAVGSPFEARPATTNSEELGEDSNIVEDGAENAAYNCFTETNATNEPVAFRALSRSASNATSDAADGMTVVNTGEAIYPATRYPYQPDSEGMSSAFHAPSMTHGVAQVQRANEGTVWSQRESVSHRPGTGSKESSGSAPLGKKKRKKDPLPIFSSPEFEERRLKKRRD